MYCSKLLCAVSMFFKTSPGCVPTQKQRSSGGGHTDNT